MRWDYGEPVRVAHRDDVLKALHGHHFGTVIVCVELPDGSTVMHLHGTLVSGSRDPDEQTDEFAVLRRGLDPQVWYGAAAAEDVGAAGWFSVPESRIVEYVSGGPGYSSYRFALGGGAQLVVTLWRDIPHLTESVAVAAGMSALEAAAPLQEDGEEGKPEIFAGIQRRTTSRDGAAAARVPDGRTSAWRGRPDPDPSQTPSSPSISRWPRRERI